MLLKPGFGLEELVIAEQQIDAAHLIPFHRTLQQCRFVVASFCAIFYPICECGDSCLQ